MKFHICIAFTLMLSGCFDFADAETVFCRDAAPEHQATACADVLGKPTGLQIAGMASSITVGACSGSIQIRAVDDMGHRPLVEQETLVTLSATPPDGVTFYSDESCTTPTSTVVLAARSNSTNFAFKSTSAGALRIDATAPQLTVGSGQVQIVTGKLAIITPGQSILADACSGIVTVQSQDSQGNVATVNSPTVLSLSTAPPDPQAGFFSDAACTMGRTQAIIQPGQSSVSFYFKSTRAGSMTLSIGAPGYDSTTQPQMIRAGDVTKLVFITNPTHLVRNACSTAATVQSRDNYDNVTTASGSIEVTLTATTPSEVTFFTDSICATAATRITIASGQSTGTIYFKSSASTPSQVDIRADATGLARATITVTIYDGLPTQIVFTSAPQYRPQWNRSNAVMFVIQDEFRYPSPLSSGGTVRATTNACGLLCSDAISSCPSDLLNIAVAAGSSSGSFYFVPSCSSGQITITISIALPSGTLMATQTETITM